MKDYNLIIAINCIAENKDEVLEKYLDVLEFVDKETLGNFYFKVNKVGRYL